MTRPENGTLMEDVERPGISVLVVIFRMLPVIPWIVRLIKYKMLSILGESRLVLLFSLIRASVMLFMFCIAYVWLMDDSFPHYTIGNVIWVIENSLVNLYAELCGSGLLCTSFMSLKYVKKYEVT